MRARRPAPVTRLRLGACAVRLHLFGSVEEELKSALRPPWPEWMRRLYGLEIGADPAPGEVTIGTALGAVAERLKKRVELASWVVGAMEDLGWQAEMDGEHLLVSKVVVPEQAWDELEEAGIAGPMSAVCDLDEHGRPRMYQGRELR
jgi:hypothetical protein